MAPSSSAVPPSLAKLHARLSKEVELFKLHIKHYHMSPTQFSKRTSQLALPDTVYEKYEKVCKSCAACNSAKGSPERGKITGMRADNFGDLIFVDHAELKLPGGTVVVLLTPDGATNLLWAHTQSSYEEKQTLQHFRDWMDQYQCTPKAVFGDMAFFTPDFQAFYRSHGIKTLPTEPRTPWPNRAETAVRLFKKQFSILLKYTPEDSSLEGITANQIVKKTVWARNNQLTISGKTPIELAFGRRPPALLDYESASPEELTNDPLETDKRDRIVGKLALKGSP